LEEADVALKVFVLFVAALALASPVVADQGPPAPADPLVLAVRLGLIRADGTYGGSAGDDGAQTVDGYVSSPDGACGIAASSTPPKTAPFVGWRYSGRVIDRTPDAIVATVEWQRLWDNNQPLVNGPKGETQVTLRFGDGVELDRVVLDGPACGTMLKLEVSSSPPLRLIRGGGGRGSGTASGSGSGTGSGGGVSVGPRSGGSGAAVGAGRGTGGGIRSGTGGRSAGGAAGRTTGPLDPDLTVEAELWLVHHPPNGQESSQRLLVRFGYHPSAFRFPAVSVSTPAGTRAIDVSGTVGLMSGTDKPRLHVVINRLIQGGSEPQRGGNSGALTTLPDPTEVLAFELPPPSSTRDEIDGHHFSIRLRLTPR
jgi:hypothetical protein